MKTTGLNAGLQPQFAGADGFAELNTRPAMAREGERPKLYPQSGRSPNAHAGTKTASQQAPKHPQNPMPQQSPSPKPRPTKPAGDWKEQLVHFVMEYKRELAATALLLASVLMLLALVSYDPLDYTNAKISAAQSAPEQAAQVATARPRSRVGIPAVTLNAEPKPYVVQNWLGYAGACVAQFIYHYTVGYAGMLFPVLLAIWAAVLYKPSAFAAKRDKIMLATGLALMGAAVAASIVGVMQLIAWMPDFVARPEWSGAVGQFIARMLWQLIGAVGAFLLLAVALGVIVFTALDLDVEKTISRAGREKARLQSMMSAYRGKETASERDAPHARREAAPPSSRTTSSSQVPQPNHTAMRADSVSVEDGDTVTDTTTDADIYIENEPDFPASPVHTSQVRQAEHKASGEVREAFSAEEPARFMHSTAHTTSYNTAQNDMTAERDMTAIRRDLLSKYGDAFNEPAARPSQQSSAVQAAPSVSSVAPPVVSHSASHAPSHPASHVALHHTNTPTVNVSTPHTHVDAAPFVYPTNASITYVKAEAKTASASEMKTDARFFDEAGTPSAMSPAMPSGASSGAHFAPASFPPHHTQANHAEVLSHVQAAAQAAAQATAEAVAHATAQMTAFETAKMVAIEAARETAQIAAQEAIREALHSSNGSSNGLPNGLVHTAWEQGQRPEHKAESSLAGEAMFRTNDDEREDNEQDDTIHDFAATLPANIAATLVQAEAVKTRAHGLMQDRVQVAADSPLRRSIDEDEHKDSSNHDDLPPIRITTSSAAAQPTQPDVFAEAGKKAAHDLNAALDEELGYIPPTLDLLAEQEFADEINEAELRENARLLTEKLRTFRIEIENLTVTPGPVVTQYEFVPAAGIKVSQIEGLADDIALALKARGIRIMAPVPGRGTVAVEIPNHKPTMVRFSSIVDSDAFRDNSHRLPLALGKTISGEVFCADLAKMPHLLIAGSTGSGKSVGINTILASLLYKMHPRYLKFLIVDPKKIEMSQYKPLLKHFLAVCPDIDESIITNPQNAVTALKSVEAEMERRYDVLAKVGQRNIADYNQKVAEGRYKDTSDVVHREMPYIVVVIDELADLMMTAGREVEDPIIRLAQLARAVGIHLIVATQRPSVDVVTGLIKANFPARIAFQVASKVDSRTILDMSGAEHLLGNGDMLFTSGGASKPLRVQNSFLSTEEVERVCEHISGQQGYSQAYMLPSVSAKSKSGKGGAGSDGDDRDEMFEEAAQLVVRHQQGSVSLLQRRLKIGYSRAARIMDQLEEVGVVGPFDGSKGRTVLMASEAELDTVL